MNPGIPLPARHVQIYRATVTDLRIHPILAMTDHVLWSSAPMPFGVYIHYPFCARLCPYCDFNVAVRKDVPDQRYADAVVHEARIRAVEANGRSPVHSLYFGGGTPGMWTPSAVGRVISGITDVYGLSDGVEITLELNPENASHERFEALLKAGVNRLSVGGQSFQDNRLKTLGRLHSSEQIYTCIEGAFQVGFENISLDLIHGMAGQTLDDSRSDLRAAMALGVNHISFYQLTVEPTTVFGDRNRRGDALVNEESVLVEMYEDIRHQLRQGGYCPYEVSSAARSGFESRHNHVYWTGGEYLGLGAGAHGFLKTHSGGTRWSNHRHPDTYMDLALDGIAPETGRQTITAAECREERVMLGLRMDRGVMVDEHLHQAYGSAAQCLIEEGLLVDDTERWRVTDRGRLLLDTVVFRLVGG